MKVQLTKLSRGALAPLFWVLAASAAFAADGNGQFAIKGAGLQTCERFETAMEAQTQDVALYGGWIEGFVTAQNQHLETTFDIAPWQTTSTLLSMTRSVCAQAPNETRFIDAFAAVFRLLTPSRLTEESEIIGFTNGDASSVAYREILKRLQQALRDEGYDIANQDGDFDEVAMAYLRDYQARNRIPTTGLPDQQTLYALLFSN